MTCLLCNQFTASDYVPLHEHLKREHDCKRNDVFHLSCRAIQSNRHYIYTLPDGRDCMDVKLNEGADLNLLCG